MAQKPMSSTEGAQERGLPMTPPADPPIAPDDRPTTPLAALASSAHRTPESPPVTRAASPPPYRPVAGGDDVYRPASHMATPAPPQRPVPPLGQVPARRWPWVLVGALVILGIVGIAHNDLNRPAPAEAIGLPGTPSPVPTMSDPSPVPTAVPTPSIGPRVLLVPQPTRAVLPTPHFAGSTPRTTPLATSETTPRTSAPTPAPRRGTDVGGTPTPTPDAVSTPSPAATVIFYPDCAAARAAGAAPLHRGDPGYRPALDRDGDGVACE